MPDAPSAPDAPGDADRRPGSSAADAEGMAPPAEALAVLRRLRDAGHEAYFCGGCVRDRLLGVAPKDWDIATSARPEEVEALFAKTVAVGRAFGVMVVVGAAGQYEVATFRTEDGYRDGRRPEEVAFAGAREDVLRRDFTVNALLYDPLADEVLDFVGGRADLAARRIRTVGEPRTRFLEDHLRLLRAVRFAARTGFFLEEATRAAIGEMAGLVRTVSAERVGAELTRMWTEGGAGRALAMLEEGHLLLHALPEIAVLRGTPQPAAFHPEGDVLTHTRLMLECMEEGSPAWAPADAFEREALAWAVVLHDVGKPGTLAYADRIRFHEHDARGAEMAEEILRRLKRPRRVAETVRDLIGRHIHFANLKKMREAKLRRWLREPAFPLHLELHRLDCTSSHRQLETYRFALAAWEEERARPPATAPLLTGKDLLAAGYRPGPRMGEILHAVEDARLENRVTTRAEALAWVNATYPPSADAS